jgi:UDP-N-acetylglucosamine:LPS N-acetylglucosamine transferase
MSTRIDSAKPPKLLAVASGGGHWVQLLRLRPAFEGCRVVYASVHQASADEVPGHRFHAFRDASRKNRLAFFVVLAQMLLIVLRERPDVIVTTGSAPALFCLAFGRLFGARTLWIDSIANCKELSTSGRHARKIAHRVVSQWPEVAAVNGIEFWGRTL